MSKTRPRTPVPGPWPPFVYLGPMPERESRASYVRRILIAFESYLDECDRLAESQGFERDSVTGLYRRKTVAARTKKKHAKVKA